MGNTQEKYGDLLERYKRWMRVERDNSESTVKQMIMHTRHFMEWIEREGVNIKDVGQDTVNKYLEECREKYHPNTMVAITANLRKLFIYFLGKDIHIKMVQPKAPDRDKTPLTREEIERIFEVAKEDALTEAIMKTLYYAGVRQAELRNLDLSDVDFYRLQITVKHGKNDVHRVVNITNDCAIAIQRYIVKRPAPKEGHEDALFLTRDGERLKRGTVRYLVKKYAAKAGIKKYVYPHKFRITMITHMAEAGLSPKEIQAQSGHKNLSVLLGYVQHTPQRIRSAYDKAFETEEISIPKTGDFMEKAGETYKKQLLKKFLEGEINGKMLDNLMKSMEQNDDGHKNKDIAYG